MSDSIVEIDDVETEHESSENFDDEIENEIEIESEIEIKNIESKIKDKLDQSKINQDLNKKGGKIAKKPALVEKIIELEKTQNPDLNEKSRYKSLHYRPIRELESILGNLSNDVILEINGMKQNQNKNLNQNQQPTLMDLGHNQIAKFLYKMDLGIMGMLEDLSINYEDDLGIGTNLKGSTVELTKHERELTACFNKIYQDQRYKEIIDQYMTPTTMILAINGLVIQKSLAMNVKKDIDPRLLAEQEQYKNELKKRMMEELQQQ